MTVREVMEATDRRRPNLYSREEKLRWLEEAEAMVWGALAAFSMAATFFTVSTVRVQVLSKPERSATGVCLPVASTLGQ